MIGNHTQKYNSRNPAIRWLTERFVRRLDHMMGQIHDMERVERPLEVGAGEGVISQRLFRRFGTAVAVDLPDASLRAEWAARPGPHYLHGDAQRLPFPDGSFDLVVCIEVMEHLRDPDAGLAELARVGRRDLLLSVPREPIFRSCNLITGRYIRELGNTPGHVNHWSTRQFATFASTVGTVREVAQPFPWTMLWVRLAD